MSIFFNAGTGVITDECRSALEQNGSRSFFGTDAGVQPGELQATALQIDAISTCILCKNRTGNIRMQIQVDIEEAVQAGAWVGIRVGIRVGIWGHPGASGGVFGASRFFV